MRLAKDFDARDLQPRRHHIVSKHDLIKDLGNSHIPQRPKIKGPELKVLEWSLDQGLDQHSRLRDDERCLAGRRVSSNGSTLRGWEFAGTFNTVW